MVISDKNRQIMERVLDTINWDLVFKFYKLVGRTIGTESNQIPGIKKIEKGSKLTKENIRDEVFCLITYVMENDISQFLYGPWEITWVNGEWEVEIEPDNKEDGEEINDEDRVFIPIGESLLELHFSPVVISVKDIVVENSDESPTQRGNGITKKDLEQELDKAVDEENYELASRLRDVINIYKNKK
jgi:hypothetical protein